MQQHQQLNPQQETLLRSFAALQHPQQQALVEEFLAGKASFEHTIYLGLDQLLVLGPELTTREQTVAAEQAARAREEAEMGANDTAATPVYKQPAQTPSPGFAPTPSAAPVVAAADTTATDESPPEAQDAADLPTTQDDPDPDEFVDPDSEEGQLLSGDDLSSDFQLEEW